MHIRTVVPDDFFQLDQFDPTPLGRLRSGELRLFVNWCQSISFVLVDCEDRIHGMALSMRDASGATLFLHFLIVEARYRGLGWGGQLLDCVEQAARELTARDVTLFTSKTAEFYLQRGYSISSEPVPGVVVDSTSGTPTGHFLSKAISVA